MLPPPAQVALHGAVTAQPATANIGKAKAAQAGQGPPVKSPPLGHPVFISSSSVQPGNPAALLKGPWLADAVDTYLSVLEKQMAVTPEVIEHYRTLCGLVDKWKDIQGYFRSINSSLAMCTWYTRRRCSLWIFGI